MKTPFIIGEQIYLRPLQRDDLNERYLTWLNDPEINRYLETGIFPSTQEDLEHFYERVMGSPNAVMLAIIEKSSDRHIGNIKLEPIHWVHRWATLGILIGEKDCWGKGYGVEAVRLMVKYAFERLNLQKVDLGVIADNIRAVKAYEKVGFIVEGRLKRHVFLDGKYVDVLKMAIFRENFISQG